MRTRKWWLQIAGITILLFVSLGSASSDKNETLGVGDVLELSVMNHSEYDQILTVLADGCVVVKGCGSMNASGLTEAELQENISRELNKKLNNAVICVNLKESRSRLIRVLGNVKQPGELVLRRGMRLLDAIANSGGFLTPQMRVAGKLVRGNGGIFDLDVAQAMLRPLGDSNPILDTGDLIILEEVQNKKVRVHIIGEVVNQGVFEMQRDCTLASLLSEAGGPTVSADIGASVVWRGREKMTALPENTNKEDWMNAARGFVLEDGDLVVVPKNQNNFAIIGQIGKPGLYPISPPNGVPIMNALAEALGPTSSADLSKAVLIRNRVDQSVIVKINLNDLLSGKEYVGVKVLNAGDILYIPPKGNRRLGWEDILAPLTALNVLGVRLFH
jgi:protein involved in polysaccharide export with SLBB domain